MSQTKTFVATIAALCLPLSGLLAQPHRMLKGSLHPLARPEFDRGRADGSTRMSEMSLIFRRSPEQQAGLDQLLSDLQNPSSPLYHQWLTPDQFADRFGASRQDIDQATAWLQSNGFTVGHAARGRDYILFSGTAAQVENAMQTEIHRYDVNGETHYANAGEPSLPEHLAGRFGAIYGLNDFRPKAPRHTARRRAPVASFQPRPDFYVQAFQDLNILAPDDLATIYNVNGLYRAGYDGSGQKLVILGESEIDVADINAFRSVFNLPPNEPRKLLVPGSQNPGKNGAEFEADLDLEWSGAIARNATILYVYSQNVFVSAFYAIDQALAPVMSFSFGLCELHVPPSELSTIAAQAQKGAALGITWLVSSGDSGAAGCEDQNGGFTAAITRMSVNMPANLPDVTAVGGTEFNEGNGNYWAGRLGPNGGSAMSYIPETSWTDEALIGQNQQLHGFASSGGGASWYVNKPSWQKGPGVPNDGARNVPDVALTASWFHDPFALVNGGNLYPSGGTSAAAPSFAGIVVLLNQYVVANGLQSRAGLGNINPMLYSLAQTSPNTFHDVTLGSNIVPCVPRSSQDCPNGSMGYTAGPGYDMVTGLGSVDAFSLALNWKGQTQNNKGASLVVTAFTSNTTVKAGGSLTLSWTVANQGTADAGPFETRVYFTSNKDISTAASWYVYCSADKGLAAGAKFTCSGSLDLDPSITPGTYYLLAVADAKNSVPQNDHSGAAALASTGPLTVTR